MDKQPGNFVIVRGVLCPVLGDSRGPGSPEEPCLRAGRVRLAGTFLGKESLEAGRWSEVTESPGFTSLGW